MAKSCCKNPSCQAQCFTIFEITQIRTTYFSLPTEQAKTQHLITLFKSFHTVDLALTSWIIGEESYAIILNKKPICPNRFSHIFGISFLKMKEAAINAITLTPKPPTPISTQTSQLTKTEQIKNVLQEYFDKGCTIGMVNDLEIQFMHGFQTRKQLYEAYCAEEKHSSTLFLCTYDTFTSIWCTTFPRVWLAGDILCSVCYKFQAIITTHSSDSFGT
jgi:hypothetical protein